MSTTFDEKQLEAVKTGKGQFLVAAGAGSGKTRVLTHRVSRLIEEDGVRPENILVFTFTNAAAKEMKTRLVKLIGKDGVDMLNIGTMHSQLNAVLRQYISFYKQSMNRYTIMDEYKQFKLIKDVFKMLKIRVDRYSNPKSASSKISHLKDRLMNLSDYRQELQEAGAEEVANDWFFDFYPVYERERERNRYIGFDDMISETYYMLKACPMVLDQCQAKFHYVMIDEFQDTNKAQLEVCRLIQGGQKNFFAVGDFRQSIFGFRNAVPEYMVEFKKFFPDGEVIELEYNYRCPENIIEAGNDLISNGKWKCSRTKAHRHDEQGTINFFPPSIDGDEEAENIVNEIQALEKSGVKYKDMVVLYRTNAQSRPLEEALIKRLIPYHVQESFYDSAEIRDMVSYLEVIRSEKNLPALFRILNKPNRFLGKAFEEQLQARIKQGKEEPLSALMRGAFSHGYMNTGALEFASVIRRIREMKFEHAGEAINAVLKMTKYEEWLQEHTDEQVFINKQEKLVEIATIAANFQTLDAFLDYLALLKKKRKDEDSDAVSLMTIHRAKGLEFPVVFVVGVSDNILPHARSTDVDEERRLMYVAVTRAETYLGISHVLTRFDKEVGPSPFLAELGWDGEEYEPDGGVDKEFDRVIKSEVRQVSKEVLNRAFDREDIISDDLDGFGL